MFVTVLSQTWLCFGTHLYLKKQTAILNPQPSGQKEDVLEKEEKLVDMEWSQDVLF